MSISKEVNEIISCCSVTITPLTRPHTPTSVCTHCEQKRNPHPLLPRALLTPPSRPAQTDQNFPWVAAQRYGEPWRGALLFPSRGWRGACFPPLPFRTQTGMYLGQPGRGWTCQGSAGGMGVAMTASFRFLAFLSLAPSSLSPRSRPARADAAASPGPGSGWGESLAFLSGQPPLLTLRTMRRPPPPSTRTHIPHSPRHAPLAGGGSLHPRKRAMEQFTAATSSWSSFLSGDKRRGYKPVAA